MEKIYHGDTGWVVSIWSGYSIFVDNS